MEPIAVRVSEAAAALRLSRSFVYELIGSGQLRVVKVGKVTLVPRSELDRFIADRLPSGEPEPGARSTRLA